MGGPISKGSSTLLNKSGASVNPATENTLESTQDILMELSRELKKIVLHLEAITNERIKDTDVEV